MEKAGKALREEREKSERQGLTENEASHKRESMTQMVEGERETGGQREDRWRPGKKKQ